jgi:hypothetical protein
VLSRQGFRGFQRDMRLQGFDGSGTVSRSFSLAPLLSYDENINGGLLEDRLWLNGWLFLADPAMKAKAGVVGGATLAGSLRQVWSEGRALSLAALSELALALTGEVLSTVVPSNSVSTSARKTSPTLDSPGSTAASSTPFGTRAPAARQVHVPSGRALVNSISILRDIVRHATRGTSGLSTLYRDGRSVSEQRSAGGTGTSVGVGKRRVDTVGGCRSTHWATRFPTSTPMPSCTPMRS